MGAHMARNLLKGGHTLVVNGKFPVPDDIRSQTQVVEDSSAVAKASEIVITMVPDTPDVNAVLFADDGVANGLSKGKLVIDMSSINPLDTQEFAKKINALGCDYLDAPVSGGEVGARDATLTIMVGGPEKSFNLAKPLFDLMGKNISHIGDNGAGQTCKVANQIIVALNIEAVAEALLFAARSGADPERVRKALMGGFAASRILELHGERMTKRTFNPGFRIELHQKDLNLALDGARKMGLALPHTASAQQLFSVCAANGGKAWDHSAMVRALEIMSNFQVADEPQQAKAAA
jgi:2-hydroxy-3-oxopropionate reductase